MVCGKGEGHIGKQKIQRSRGKNWKESEQETGKEMMSRRI